MWSYEDDDEDLNPIDVVMRSVRGLQYYEYVGAEHISIPPISTSGVRIGTLFVHRLDEDDAHYAAVWMFNRTDRWTGWIRCHGFESHPELNDRVLLLRAHRGPSWVARKIAIDRARID